MTQKDLREVDSSGTLKAGEKVLGDLRKRKLIVQKCVHQIHHLVRYAHLLEQKGTMVHRRERAKLQHIHGKAGNRSHSRHAHIVRCFLPICTIGFLMSTAEAHGRHLPSRNTTSRRRVSPPMEAPYIRCSRFAKKSVTFSWKWGESWVYRLGYCLMCKTPALRKCLRRPS